MSAPNYAPPTQQTVVTTSVAGRLVKQVTDQLYFHQIPEGTTYALFDDSQNGALQSFEISTDNANLILQIYWYADNPSVINYVNQFQMHELLSLGRGLTPGDVQILPNNQGQDIPGRPSSRYPYLARFKFDSVPDFTAQFQQNINFNSAAPLIVLKYEPVVELPYKRIVANIINSDTVNPANIISLDIKRAVFQDLAPGETPPPDPNANLSNIRRTIALPVKPTLSKADYTWKAKQSAPAEDPVYET